MAFWNPKTNDLDMEILASLPWSTGMLTGGLSARELCVPITTLADDLDLKVEIVVDALERLRCHGARMGKGGAWIAHTSAASAVEMARKYWRQRAA